jgi:rfaE bifunctional protein kinase chain/domain
VNADRFHALTANYPRLRIALVGDFCLDRYLEIDPTRQERSIETGLPVHNVVKVRAQPGGAGTILNNLVALGVGTIHPIGFAGEDGEGYELRRSLAAKPGVVLDGFIQTDQRRTFTYCKPLVVTPGKSPVELNRLDSKNWTPTPALLQGQIIRHLELVSSKVDAIVVLEQVDLPDTGVVTTQVRGALSELAHGEHTLLPIIADSRRGARGFQGVMLKMNEAELVASLGARLPLDLPAAKDLARELARQHQRKVFVTLAERGLLGAHPAGDVEHVPALPLRGEIDIVGAGDAVTANLSAALAAGATLREALELANAAASVVIHQLGTTGTASVVQLAERLT